MEFKQYIPAQPMYQSRNQKRNKKKNILRQIKMKTLYSKTCGMQPKQFQKENYSDNHI